MYVFDTSPLVALFDNFYRSRFPSLWEKFDQLVADGRIVSTREVMREVADGPVDTLRVWAAGQNDFFHIPTAAEGAFVGEIYAVAHFQQNFEQRKLLKGGRNADPFVVAKARVEGKAVVTLEQLKPNGTKIPNICQRFNIDCLSLETFMEREGWRF